LRDQFSVVRRGGPSETALLHNNGTVRKTPDTVPVLLRRRLPRRQHPGGTVNQSQALCGARVLHVAGANAGSRSGTERLVARPLFHLPRLHEQARAAPLIRRWSLAELGSRWARDDAAARLALVAQVLRLLGWRASGLSAARPGPLNPLARLTARMDFSKLWSAWDSANRARREIGGPLRAELVLVEVLKNCSELAA